MNANDSHQQARDRDMRLQAEADRAEREALAPGGDPRVDRYRLVVRALRRPLQPQLPADFAARVAAMASRTCAKACDGFEDWLVGAADGRDAVWARCCSCVPALLAKARAWFRRRCCDHPAWHRCCHGTRPSWPSSASALRPAAVRRAAEDAPASRREAVNPGRLHQYCSNCEPHTACRRRSRPQPTR